MAIITQISSSVNWDKLLYYSDITM